MEILCKHFDDLSKKEFHDILKLRTDIFVVEQECAYAEIDGKDPQALHLFHVDDGDIITVARILHSDWENKASIGRVAVHKNFRGRKLGHSLMVRCLREINQRYVVPEIHVSAQDYLLGFYNALGFEQISDPYDWDGIIHIDMVLRPQS